MRNMLLVGLLALLFAPNFVSAQGTPELMKVLCYEYTSAVKILKNQYDERLMKRYYNENDLTFVEEFRSAAGSWTFLAVYPALSKACVLASGHSWKKVAPLPDDPGV